ncbi:MAG: hypothetical protein FD181_2681 [Prolixibacteraceae bacterium]|nr:MAG: hypothetical protein FD181_2681 [Prolixibacteraceae bacterium]
MKREIDMSLLSIEEQKLILEGIAPSPGKKYTEIDSEGTFILYDEITEYLNNLENLTFAGLELRKRQCSQTIKICDEILDNRNMLLSIFDKEDVIKDRNLFLHLSERLSIHLDGKKESRYIIKDDGLVKVVFEICKTAIDCDYLTFRKSIETADFSLLNIRKQNFIQELTYRLSGIMDEEWYSDICKKMQWKKTVVSGHGSKLENNVMLKQLDRKLKRPKKER